MQFNNDNTMISWVMK